MKILIFSRYSLKKKKKMSSLPQILEQCHSRGATDFLVLSSAGEVVASGGTLSKDASYRELFLRLLNTTTFALQPTEKLKRLTIPLAGGHSVVVTVLTLVGMKGPIMVAVIA